MVIFFFKDLNKQKIIICTILFQEPMDPLKGNFPSSTTFKFLKNVPMAIDSVKALLIIQVNLVESNIEMCEQI